jgi:superfamily I DNA/RNA helicase
MTEGALGSQLPMRAVASRIFPAAKPLAPFLSISRISSSGWRAIDHIGCHGIDPRTVRPTASPRSALCFAAGASASGSPPSPSTRPSVPVNLPPYLASLSPEQLAAAAAPLVPTRVVAGPGSGKTRVLIARVSHLIHDHGAQPWQIAAITFTNKAAGELKERLGITLGEEAATAVFAGTFHSLCYRLLRKGGMSELPEAGRTSAFTLYDEEAAKAVITKLVRQEEPHLKVGVGLFEWDCLDAASPFSFALLCCSPPFFLSERRFLFFLEPQELSLPRLLRAYRIIFLFFLFKKKKKTKPYLFAPQVTDVKRRVRSLSSSISRVKNAQRAWAALRGKEVVFSSLRIINGSDDTFDKAYADDLAHWYDLYEDALKGADAVDFDDLLGLTAALLARQPRYRDRLRRRIRYLLIDEFQDTNTTQYELVRLIAGEADSEWVDKTAAAAAAVDESGNHGVPQGQQRHQGAHLYVVGDPDQAIYGWRGADPFHMRRAFKMDFPRGETFFLSDNYRSTEPILKAASAVIAANPADASDGCSRALRPIRGVGSRVRVVHLRDAEAEAMYIAEEVESTLKSGRCKPENIAILLRVHFQAVAVEKQLAKRGIKYVLVGGLPFWRRKEVQDVMAYLRLAVCGGARGSDVAVDRVINLPKRGLGDAAVAKLNAYAQMMRASLSEALFGGDDYDAAAAGGGGDVGELPRLPSAKELGISAKALESVEAFRTAVWAARAEAARGSLSTAIRTIIQQASWPTRCFCYRVGVLMALNVQATQPACRTSTTS